MRNHCTSRLQTHGGTYSYVITSSESGTIGGRVAVTWWLNPVVFSRFLILIFCDTLLMLYATCSSTIMASPFVTNTNRWTLLRMALLVSSAKYGRRMARVWYVLLVALSCSQAHGCFSQIFARKELNFERMSERDRK